MMVIHFKESNKIFEQVQSLEVKGGCECCGRCCEFAHKFSWLLDREPNLKLEPDHSHIYPFKKLCSCFDLNTKECARHKEVDEEWKKPEVCKRWPFFEEDLEIIICPFCGKKIEVKNHG